MGLDILSFDAAGVRRCRAYRLVHILTAEVTSLKLAKWLNLCWPRTVSFVPTT